MLIRQKLPRQFRELPLTEHLRPDGTVCLISPCTIIIVGRSIIVPSLATITRQQFLQIRFQVTFIDRIPLFFQETQYKHIKEHPVGTDCRPFSVTQHSRRQRILLHLSQRLPQNLTSRSHRNSQRTQFQQCLARPSLTVRDIVVTFRIGNTRQLMTVIIRHFYPVHHQIRIILQERCGNKQCPGEPFQLRDRNLPVILRICLFQLFREIHWVIQCTDITECTFQQIFPGLYPMFPCHSRIRALPVIRSPQSKYLFPHKINLLVQQSIDIYTQHPLAVFHPQPETPILLREIPFPARLTFRRLPAI